MLPSLLSEQLCSLRQGHERLAVSVIWTLASATDFTVRSVWYGRTIIRSRHELHYQQAQDIVDGKAPAPGDELPVQDRLTLAWALDILVRLTASLHAMRVENGALELSSSELRFTTDEKGQPVAVKAKPKVPMMDVVAEMMIWTNAAVAQRTAAAFPGAALLRNHPPPREEAFEQVRAVLEQGALGPSSKILAGAAVPGTAGAYHYGLALQYYTHFTSPIRRYADVVAHRQLLAALQASMQPLHQEQGSEPTNARPAPAPPIPHAELMVMAERMNEQHRASKAAQKECMELYLLLLLHSQPHVESALLISLQGRDQLDVFVPSIQLRGRVRVVDSRGRVQAPLTGAEEGSDAAAAAAAAASASLSLSVSEDKHHVAIVDTPTNTPVWSASMLERVWLMMDADGSRAHGPRLRMRLAAASHPMVQAKQAEIAAAKLEEGKAAAATAVQTTTTHSIGPAAQQMLAMKGINLPPTKPPSAPSTTPAATTTPVPPPLQPTLPDRTAASDSMQVHVQAQALPTQPSIASPSAVPPLAGMRPAHTPAAMSSEGQQQGDGMLPDVEDVLQGGGPVPGNLQACAHMPMIPGLGATASVLRHYQSALARYEAKLSQASLRRAGRHKQAWHQKLLLLQQHLGSSVRSSGEESKLLF
ncbi:hypothetical protein DUNSADRAFT_5221 [Dunaliella salina]|uniref:DIS3-like exonuclease 1 n=1 Tax=Dunaliella salina TaxID=3046 RepID=A0ABQ7GQR4_DUNSA|nr:hypothetical protein DUNSADRAFT_5221 [Dunaliella salina]|eukprot:KAF5836944.1 hypothetical protein DUNSADRAFT_5221 [Dunaliella salina]